MSKAARIQINKGQIYYSEEELAVISEIKENYEKYLDFEDEEIAIYILPVNEEHMEVVKKIEALEATAVIDNIVLRPTDIFSEKEWKEAVAYAFIGEGLDYAFTDSFKGEKRVKISEMKDANCMITEDEEILVSSYAKEIMMQCGASSEDFQKVRNKLGVTSCWKIHPQNVVQGLAKDNGWKRVKMCFTGNPYERLWISEENLRKLTALSYMREPVDRVPSPKVIVSKEFCQKLLEYVDEIDLDEEFDFEPIFLRTENVES